MKCYTSLRKLTIFLFLGSNLTNAYNINLNGSSESNSNKQPTFSTCCSRNHVLSVFQGMTLSSIVLTNPKKTKALSPSGSGIEEDLKILNDASTTLSSLLENWDRATIDCTYADVPRELLETKNKEKLLEKAATSALFDKSASVISCRKNNRVVRDYIGVTGKGPLVGAEKRILKRQVVDTIDPDNLDNYFNEVEAFSKALSRASSLSYVAGVADFDSVNNFAKDEANQTQDENSNLQQTKIAILDAKTSLDKILSLFPQSQRI